jgi:type II secretory pathway component PulF
LRKFFAHLGDEARSGRPISSALSNGDIAAPAFCRALVRTGESIGALAGQFTALAAHYEGALKMRREIVAQLVYPAALMALILLTMVFLSFVVLPQFALIFENAGAPPPIETRLALGAGAFIRSYIFYAPIVLLALAAGWRYFRKRCQPQLEKLLLATPVVGPLRRSYEIGRYCRALSTMLKGGMALAEAMPLARQTVQMGAIREELDRMEASVRTGSKVADALRANAAPAKEIVSFLEVGDETGALGEMAAQAAHFAEERVNSAIKRFMALLSPALTAIMGLATAGVIAAVMSGVLSLNDAVY